MYYLFEMAGDKNYFMLENKAMLNYSGTSLARHARTSFAAKKTVPNPVF